MKCPECGSPTEMMVSVTMLIPSEMEGVLSKTNIRNKEVKVYAVSWDRAAYFCKNKKCRWQLTPKLFRGE